MLVLLEALGALLAFVGVGILLGRRPRRRQGAPFVAAALLGVGGVVHVSEALEWSGATRFTQLGETLSVLIPALWLFLVLSMVRQQLLNASRSQRQQLELVIESAPAAIAIVTRDGEYLLTNAHWGALFHGGAPLQGRSIRDLSADVDALITDMFEEVRGAGESAESLPIPMRLGERDVWIQCFASPWQFNPGELGGIVVVAHELTRQVTAELEARALQEELQHRNRMDLVGILASGVAHDMRNFLTVLSAHVELLRFPDVTEEDVIEATDAMDEALGQATHLLESLTHLSHKRAEEPQPIALADFLRGCERLFSRSLPRSVRLTLEIDEGPLPIVVHAIPVKLKQVVLNLIINARDAMPGGGTVTLALHHRTEGERRWASLRVSDEGVGMTDEIKARIFEALFTTKAPGEGTGLGLAIVHGVVTEHGGTLEVESAPGEGTSIVVSLPQVEPSEGARRGS